MNLVWQIRHTVVHNVGVITKSDAVKLSVLAGEGVEGSQMLAPARNDLRWLKMFLDDTAEDCNTRIGKRLAELLSTIHAKAPTLLDPQETANRISGLFCLVLPVAGVNGVLPP